jgi:tRNA (cytidine/uridine-2'-O-)-methyltransferase
LKYQPTLHIVLHQPEIPPNTGAIGRTCVALQAKLWLVKPLGFEVTEKAVRRAGLDYWQHLEWQTVEDFDDLQVNLPSQNYWLFSRFATQNYLDAPFQQGDVLIFGRETKGLPKSIVDRFPERLLRIETHPNVRSLNLSSAVAVAGFEAMRQIGRM